MSTATIQQAAPSVRAERAAMTSWEKWGLALVVPYLLIFLVFVIYPVGYGLWLARHPDSYVRLFADPIFFRSLINTVVFIVVAVNLKMVVALFLSGFFLNTRWWIKALSVIFILPWAVPSIPTILSMRFMLIQMSKALGALLRTSFEISTSRKDGPKRSLPLHRAVLDAVIAHNPAKAEKAILMLIDGAHEDIELVLGSRRRLPQLSNPAKQLKASA